MNNDFLRWVTVLSFITLRYKWIMQRRRIVIDNITVTFVIVTNKKCSLRTADRKQFRWKVTWSLSIQIHFISLWCPCVLEADVSAIIKWIIKDSPHNITVRLNPFLLKFWAVLGVLRLRLINRISLAARIDLRWWERGFSKIILERIFFQNYNEF